MHTWKQIEDNNNNNNNNNNSNSNSNNNNIRSHFGSIRQLARLAFEHVFPKPDQCTCSVMLVVLTDSSGYVKGGIGMKSHQFLHKLHWQPAVYMRYSEYKKHVLPGRSLIDLTARIMASTGECCVVSYFLNDWQHFVDPSPRHLFHSNLVRFCEALRQQFQTSFVFVGG